MKRRPGGFVLLLVLASLVVLSLLAAAIATRVERAVQDQAAEEQALRDAIDAESTRATVLYVASTRRYTFGGLTIDDAMVLRDGRTGQVVPGAEIDSYTPIGNEIRVDGTPYRGLGDTRFAIQDDRGRISINFSPRVMLDLWLQGRGVEPSERTALYSSLLDYQDPDDLTRVGGAEADEYREAGLPPPPNRTLMTPLELRRVMGWREPLAALSDEELVRIFSVARSALVNVNSASADVLATLPGWNPEVAARIVAHRRDAMLPHTLALRAVAGTMPLDPDAVILFPGDVASLTTWVPGRGNVLLEQWQLTPMDDGGRPWRTLYRLWLPAPDNAHGIDARPTGAPVFGDPAATDQ